MPHRTWLVPLALLASTACVDGPADTGRGGNPNVPREVATAPAATPPPHETPSPAARGGSSWTLKGKQ